MDEDHLSILTDPTTLREAATNATPGARIVVEARRSVTDPFEAYRSALNDEPGVYLETTGGSDGWGYFGVTPDEFITVGPNESGALDTLQSRIKDESLIRGSCNVPHPGGLFGWLSYDVVRDIESLPDTTIDDRDCPRMQFGVYPVIAAWKEPFEAGDDLRLLAAVPLERPDTSTEDVDFDDAFETGCERIHALDERIQTGNPEVDSQPTGEYSRTDEYIGFQSGCGKAAFEERVRTIKEYIRDGDTFQTNISHRLESRAPVHPVEVYASLRESNPAPYAGLIEFPRIDLVSASPELLLAKRGDNITTEPIAGTRPRGDTVAEDEALAEDLVSDGKERAEHAMLVDLERNDLGKVSEYGSVEVNEYRRIDRYSEVMHLVSEIRGKLRADTDLADTIGALFPGGTITGAPKPRTMELIDAVEDTRRGPYTGSMGVVGFDGDVTLNITIRTLVRHANEYHLRVGAGIVHDSDPATEYAETLDKARALVTAIDKTVGVDTSPSLEGEYPTETGMEDQ